MPPVRPLAIVFHRAEQSAGFPVAFGMESVSLYHQRCASQDREAALQSVEILERRCESL